MPLSHVIRGVISAVVLSAAIASAPWHAPSTSAGALSSGESPVTLVPVGSAGPAPLHKSIASLALDNLDRDLGRAEVATRLVQLWR